MREVAHDWSRVEGHLGFVRSMAARLAEPNDVDDVAQEALERAARARSGPAPGNERRWLFSIVRNTANTFRRRPVTVDPRPCEQTFERAAEEEEEESAFCVDGEEYDAARLASLALREANGLRDVHRETLEFFYLEGPPDGWRHKDHPYARISSWRARRALRSRLRRAMRLDGEVRRP